MRAGRVDTPAGWPTLVRPCPPGSKEGGENLATGPGFGTAPPPRTPSKHRIPESPSWREARGVRPWMIAVLGLGIALAAIYALVTGVFVGGGEGGDEIDAQSRESLRELLKEAE